MYNYEIIVTVNFLFYPQQRKLVYLIQVALLKTNSYEIFNNNVAPRSCHHGYNSYLSIKLYPTVHCRRIFYLLYLLLYHSYTKRKKLSKGYTHKSISKYTPIQIIANQEETKIDSLFCKKSHKRKSVKPTVLLADSNIDFRSYLETRLSDHFIVKSFGNGLEALTYIKEEYPDIVVCDTMLHGMYGNELSSRLKTSCETSIIPIILYGSYLNGRQRNTRETSLADVFINTPFHIEDLKIEMNVLIKNSRFLRKSFLQKVFGEQFLKIEEEEDTLSEKITYLSTL